MTGFPRRNGFALRSDLEHPELAALRELCERESRAFGGDAPLGWSRQWEYPWILAQLPEDGGGRRLLDAGSGYRFFTPLLARRGFAVEACDLDPRVGPRLERAAAGLPLRFRVQDLTRLDYEDACFDFVCCVSVLEHTADPAAVVREFRRCLAPGGILLLTFDVSVRGDRDIPLPRARALVALLERELEPLSPFAHRECLEGNALAASPDVLRTSWFRECAPELLPWGFASRAWLSGLRRGRLGRPFFDLAVVGMALRRPGQES